jgi:integrase
MPRKKEVKGRTRANGTGEKTVLPSGRVRWRVRNSTRETLASGTVDTDREANNAIAQAMTKRAEGRLKAKSGVTLREYAARWLELQHSLEPATRSDYRYSLERVMVHLGDRPIQSITREDVKRVLHTLAQMTMHGGQGHGRTMSARTLAQTLTRLRAVFREALEDDLITKNPAQTIKPLKTVRTEHPGITLEFAEADRLVSIGRELYALKALNLWPALFVCLSVGLRRGEVMGLTWAHIDLEKSVIRIRQQLTSLAGEPTIKPHLKTSSSRRDVDVPPSVRALLEQLQTSQRRERQTHGLPWDKHGPVFITLEGTHVHPDNLERSLKSLIDWSNPDDVERKRKDTKTGQVLKVSLPLERRLIALPSPERDKLEALVRSGQALPVISPHDLRHTAGSHMLMRGMDIEAVSDILGHKDSSVTRQIYIHITAEFRKAAMVDLFPLD